MTQSGWLKHVSQLSGTLPACCGRGGGKQAPPPPASVPPQHPCKPVDSISTCTACTPPAAPAPPTARPNTAGNLETAHLRGMLEASGSVGHSAAPASPVLAPTPPATLKILTRTECRRPAPASPSWSSGWVTCPARWPPLISTHCMRGQRQVRHCQVDAMGEVSAVQRVGGCQRGHAGSALPAPACGP